MSSAGGNYFPVDSWVTPSVSYGSVVCVCGKPAQVKKVAEKLSEVPPGYRVVERERDAYVCPTCGVIGFAS